MEEQKKFRFQNSCALLTYKTHLNKEEYIKWFTIKAKQIPTFIRLAHETGNHEENEEKYEHTHVLFKTKNLIQTTNPRFFDYQDIHPHIKILKGNKALNDAKTYIAKEDEENKDLIITTTLVDGVWAKNNIQDALKEYVKSPSDVNGIISLFNLKASNLTIKDRDIPKKKWQIELMNETIDPPTEKQERKVVWIVDPIGGAGKTKFARYKLMTEPQKWFVCKDLGTSKDGATVIKNALSSGWTGHGIIIDLPRQAQNHKRMYSYIEEIKDGMITTQKYNGQTCIFNIPHLIIFANWLPLIRMLSLDRWDIRILIRDENDIFMRPFNPDEDKDIPQAFVNEDNENDNDE